jgi:hypothetical protein
MFEEAQLITTWSYKKLSLNAIQFHAIIDNMTIKQPHASVHDQADD